MDGKTKYDKWADFARQTEQDVNELIDQNLTIPAQEYAIPDAFEYVLDWFIELSIRQRSYHPTGVPLLLNYSDIRAYQEEIGITFVRWERETILAIDAVWIDQMAKERANQEKAK